MLRFSALLAVLALVPFAMAKEEFVALVPNGANVPGVKAIGHSDGTGAGEEDTVNDFGKAFEEAGEKWTTELCQADTDGDGQTNGQELGDPCCVWSEGDTPRWTDGVSHPDDSSKMSNATLLASVDCSATTTEKASSGNGAGMPFASTTVTATLAGCSVVMAIFAGNN